MTNPQISFTPVSVGELPSVSVIVPCRNEEKFIGECLKSLITSSYDHDRLEILVVDGMSKDRTRSIIEEYSTRYPIVRYLENPQCTTPYAFNTGIKAAVGDIVMIMNAHSICDKEYISLCVRYLEEYGADNVGGILKRIPVDEKFQNKVITLALTHRFGVAGGFKTAVKTPAWSDTAAFGCYRREVFDKIGLFNEGLTRGQDMEFNLRLKRAGGKILLHPDLVLSVHQRAPRWRGFVRQYYINGMWATYPFKFTRSIPVAWRHLVPLAFVLGIGVLASLAIVSKLGVLALLAVVGLYLSISVASAAGIAWREKNPWYLVMMPIAFGVLHTSYGLGSCHGVLKAVTSKQFWTERFGPKKPRETASDQKGE